MALPVPAQNPGAQQDAEAAREKLLKAADQLDNVQANSETTRLAVDGLKTDVATLQQTVTKLQGDNAALRQQLADLQSAFDQYKADQLKARQALIDSVAEMIANKAAKSSTRKKATAENPDTPSLAGNSETSPTLNSTEVHSTPAPDIAPGLTPPPDQPSALSNPEDPAPPPPPKQKGYYHTVASGETVAMIAEAFREKGVNVTSAQIRRANSLTPDSVLKPGQKLFIPKPAN